MIWLGLILIYCLVSTLIFISASLDNNYAKTQHWETMERKEITYWSLIWPLVPLMSFIVWVNHLKK